MKALGIDPGLMTTGYGVLEQQGGKIRLIEAGTIRTGDSRVPLPIRLRRLHEELEVLLDDHEPDVMALEQLYANYEHPRTAILMGHARGVICLAAGLHDIPLFHYTASEVKSAVTGNGRASKEQIGQFVRRTFALVDTPGPADVTDAVAIAMCHLQREGGRGNSERLRLLK